MTELERALRGELCSLRVQLHRAESEVKRLRMERVGLESKNRELEQTIANCYAVGVKLNAIVDGYERDQEPTAKQLREVGRGRVTE
jgi:hypothetical protein